MAKLSVIVPVYNVENYIRECLESLINQSLQDIEIILIDDGSSDNSGKICDEYSEKDDRIKVIHKKNEGVSIARNTGIEIAKSKYITFVDSDDWIELDTYKILMSELEKNDTDLIIYNYNNYIDKKEKNKDFPEDCILEGKEQIQTLQATILAPEIGQDTFFHTKFLGLGFSCNKIYKKDILEKNNIYFNMNNKRAVCEDILFNYQYLETISNVKIINKNLYNYRKLNTSATQKYNDQILVINEFIYNEILKYRTSHCGDKYYESALNMRMIINFFLACRVYFCNKDGNKKYMQRYKEFKEYLRKEYYEEAFKKIEKRYCNIKIRISKIFISLKMYNVLFNVFYIFSLMKK